MGDGPAVTPDETADFGPCQVLLASGGAANNPPLTAGTVTITGGSQAITLMPQSNGFYPFDVWGIPGPLWNGGEMLTMSAIGDPNGVPAFSGSVVAPTHITLTSPVAPTGFVDVPRDQPLHLAWTGGTVGIVSFDMIGPFPDGPAETYCEFPASAGSATISADLLGQLPPGAATVYIKQHNTVTIHAGHFPIDLWLGENIAQIWINFR